MAVMYVLLCLMAVPFLSLSAMTWKRLDNPEAVCNDFSRAGYFTEFAKGGSDKWLIFLESGGLCFSPDTCNRRFFRPSVRREFATTEQGSLSSTLFPQFNYTVAWTRTRSRSLKQRINIYMTSMETYMADEEEWQIEGRDLLDSDPSRNPAFYDYNHVLIPYCSSDLWVGNDTRPSNIDITSADPQGQFLESVYTPESTSLQFTFRGRIILQSVLEELMEDNLLSAASDVILAGSSAGGLGAVNSAKWLREILPAHSTSLSIIADSSWFINFRGNIYRRINGSDSVFDTSMQSDSNSLLAIIESNPECLDLSYGMPCCLSMECMLANSEFFPVGEVSVIALFSLYDVYLLADAIAGLAVIGSNANNIQPEMGLDFIFTVAEYGGAMNSSIAQIGTRHPNISFIVTECLQHIYFATSSLWDSNGLLQEDTVEQLDIDLGSYSSSFRHVIRSGVWSSYYFGGTPVHSVGNNSGCDASNVATIQDAILMWRNCRNKVNHMSFRDTCFTIHCNDLCPDKLDFAVDVTLYSYPLWAKILIAIIVVSITMVSILTKVAFWIWKLLLDHKLSLYLQQMSGYDLVVVPRSDQKKIDTTFPSVELADAMSVSCLDVVYRISYRRKKKKVKTKQEDMPTSAIDDNKVNGSKKETDESGESKKFSIHLLKPPKPLMYAAEEMYLDTATSSGNCYKRQKTILKGVTAYFNPGDLVAIMGPSGSGKTTFLDLLTGRRNVGKIEGEIFVNGAPLNTVRDQYIIETGYVLQLAAPYYEELTVRENLTLAAHLKLPSSMMWRRKFERVEQVINITGLQSLGDTIVGGVSGPGLSGGQKKRLAIALQLLTMPKIIFLDEPTSGLDATASIELLTHLNALAATNRTVILTIHQPRFEIFYMFDRLILLTDGKIAYNGVPKNAYGFFVEALLDKCYADGKTSLQLEDQNPADIIMDMLARPWMRALILEHYESSKEPESVRHAIKKSIVQEFQGTDDKSSQHPKSTITKRSQRQASLFNRLAVHEARAGKRAQNIWKLYLPIFFLGYGILLGTVYFQQESGLLIVSGYCVYSVASALFMFPLLQNYYIKTLDVYKYEKADGVGSPVDLVVQGYVRFVTFALIPVVVCALLLYLLLVPLVHWNVLVGLQLIIVGMALNQTWIALLICVINAFPSYAFRISPIISSIAGFSSGFFIPREATPWIYRWIFYINPNYYGFSASAHLILSGFDLDCSHGSASPIQCYFHSGDYVLKLYNFDDIKPYQHIAVLLLMTLLYFLLAVLANWLRYTHILKKLKSKIKQYFKRGDMKKLTEEVNQVEAVIKRKATKERWMKLASKAVDQGKDFELTKQGETGRPRNYFEALLANEEHVVFKPGQHSETKFAQLVSNLVKAKRDDATSMYKNKLKQRQMSFESHVKSTQEAVSMSFDERLQKFGGAARPRAMTDIIERRSSNRDPRSHDSSLATGNELSIVMEVDDTEVSQGGNLRNDVLY